MLDVAPGTFGDHLEHELRDRGLTLGHWPQSVALSTVGGWVACRGAGQLSNRYGKIEDMVLGLDVVLADGTALSTGGAPRAAIGPDLTQLFVGSEGTLGVVTGVRLRLHPAPADERHAAWGFASFDVANDVCRRIVQRGATPAVLRVYDPTEADRSYQTGDRAVLLVMDEGDPVVVDAAMTVVAQECERTAGAEPLDDRARRPVAVPPQRGRPPSKPDRAGLRGRHHGDRRAVVAAGRHLRRRPACTRRRSRRARRQRPPVACLHRRRLPLLHLRRQARRRRARRGDPRADVPPVLGRRHSGRCWPTAGRSATTTASGSTAVRFVAEALGAGHGVLQSVKDALDPNGILNPGKFGLRSPFGEVDYP